MTLLGESRRHLGGPGMLPLRHFRFDLQGGNVEFRASVEAVEVANRQVTAGGHTVARINSVGDINGGFLWETNPGGGGRLQSQWRFSTPVILAKPDEPEGANLLKAFVADDELRSVCR